MFGKNEKKTIINVEGMTCHHCEMTVENTLNQIANIIKSKANREISQVEIISSGNIDLDSVKRSISELGYVLK